MHKDLYASGFLYHIPSQQILLQHYPSETNTSRSWSLFQGVINPKESYKTAFQRIIYANLHIKLPEDAIYEVYDYYNPDLKKNVLVVYAELNELTEFPTNQGVSFKWLHTKNVNKQILSEQVKQDITVGKRVVEARIRDLSNVINKP